MPSVELSAAKSIPIANLKSTREQCSQLSRPSVLGQDGNGAVILEEDGDERLGRPMTEFSPSPAVNYRHPRMLISQCT